MRSDENLVPNVTLYHNAKSCEHGIVSYFLGYGVNNKCNIVDPTFLENCIASNKKLFFQPKFLEKLEMNPNKKHKLLYQIKQFFKKNNKELIYDIQIHYIHRVVVEVTNDKGKKSNVVAFNGRQANGNIVKVITRNWMYTNFYIHENKFYQYLIYGYSIKHFKVSVGKSRPGSVHDPKIKLPTHGPTLKFRQSDENSCIVSLFVLDSYEFGDNYISFYIYQFLKDAGELQTTNWMVYLRDLMFDHHRMKGE